MSELSHGRKPRAKKLKGLLDNVEVVDYNTGDGFVDAFVLKQDGPTKAFLARWQYGKLEQINDGNSVPERSEAEYGTEGGGVTFKRKA